MTLLPSLHAPTPIPSESASTVNLRVSVGVFEYVTCMTFDVLSVSKVESTEQRIVLRGWLASLILIQEDR